MILSAEKRRRPPTSTLEWSCAPDKTLRSRSRSRPTCTRWGRLTWSSRRQKLLSSWWLSRASSSRCWGSAWLSIQLLPGCRECLARTTPRLKTTLGWILDMSCFYCQFVNLPSWCRLYTVLQGLFEEPTWFRKRIITWRILVGAKKNLWLSSFHMHWTNENFVEAFS